MSDLPKIVCVVGPTASGKSELAVMLARRLRGEVVSADSMQIYRGMDIGTAKPSPEERESIPHHMIDVAEPSEPYSVARYAEEAGEAVDGILRRGRLPIVAGGTGLYIDALIRGAAFAARERDGALRAEFLALAEREGAQALFEKLREADPESAARLHPNDIKRVIRALEVVSITGRTLPEHNEAARRSPPRYDAAKIGLFYSDRAALYRRIDARVDGMIRGGLLEEARRLLEIPGVREGTAMQAIGYKELMGALDGAGKLEAAVAEIKKSTRRYAKRQLTWFRRDRDIFWIDRCASDMADALEQALAFLRARGFPGG